MLIEDAYTMDIIRKWLEHAGIEQLNEMQQHTVETVMKDESIILQAPTGSGKTLAYLLPLCSKINVANDSLQVIVILPTRELAQQCENVLKKLKTSIRSLALYGGRPTMGEHRLIREISPHIIFITPGRLVDHLGKQNLLPYAVHTIVLDEFDKCLEYGFKREMHSILVACKGVAQHLFISATHSDEAECFLQESLPSVNKQLVRLDFSTSEHHSERLQICIVPSEQKDKLDTLHHLLTYLKGVSTIVFVAHRESVERVYSSLKAVGYYCVAYHGGMEQEHREKALYKFRNGSANILVSTDLAARGLDIPEVEAVVHYHLPVDESSFIHRAGRTARWLSCGTTYLIQGPQDTLPPYLPESTFLLHLDEIGIRPTLPDWTTLYIGKGKKNKVSKMDIVGLFCKRGGLTAGDIGHIDIAPHFSFVAVRRNMVRQLLRNIAGEKIKGLKTIIEEVKY